jgi:hypothetical protein
MSDAEKNHNEELNLRALYNALTPGQREELLATLAGLVKK